jgi:hypothetical protein
MGTHAEGVSTLLRFHEWSQSMEGNRQTRLAFRISAFVTVYFLLSATLFAIAYATGGSDSITDNWVG